MYIITVLSTIPETTIIIKLIAVNGKLVNIVKPKNSNIKQIKVNTVQLAKGLWKNSRLRINGDAAINIPIKIIKEDIPGEIRFNTFRAVASKVHPVKNITNPIAIMEEIALNSALNFMENQTNIKHKKVIFKNK
jgi:hypothetical protein